MEKLHHFCAWMGFGTRRRVLGLGFIVAVATIWVIASFAVQGIESAGVHPAVLTYIANSLFALYLPVHWIDRKVGKTLRHTASNSTSFESHALYSPGALRGDDTNTESATAQGLGSVSSSPPGISHPRLLYAAVIVAPLWFLAQLTFNASLQSTSVTSNTILSSASALFTYLFSIFLLSERFTAMKLGCILALIGGTAAVTLADSKSSVDGHHTLLGDVLCLVSSVIYGAYTVAIRMFLTDDETTPMTLFFGFMGGMIFVAVGIVLGIVWMAGAALGSLTLSSFGAVIAKGIFDNVLSDYLWARAILLVGPTIATSGLSLQVPIAVVLDAIFRNPDWMHSVNSGLLTFLGGVAVLGGFFGLASGSSGAGAEQQWERHAAEVRANLEQDDLQEEDMTTEISVREKLDDAEGRSAQSGNRAPSPPPVVKVAVD